MKTVKVVLGIIIFLSVVFFATGLVVKENSYTVDVQINKPLTESFKVFNDLSKVQKWIPEIKKIDTIQFNSGISGSKFEMVVDNQGEEITMQEKVLVYVANEKVTLYFDAEGMLKTDEYLFKEIDGKTHITLNSTFVSEDSYLLSCVFPYFKSTVRDIDQQYLNNFKAFIEQ